MNVFSEYKAIASCFYESYNRRDTDKAFFDFIAPGVVNHTMGGTLGRAKWLKFDKQLLVACPDLRLTVKEQFVEDNRVVTHWSCCGTHLEDFFGMEATGNEIHLTAISIDTIQSGKITQHLTVADFTKFIQQFCGK